MKKEQLASLLGRPLTSIEDENYKTYLKIATETLESMLCADLSRTVETRYFDTRNHYHTVFVGYFTAINSVKIDDVLIDPSEYSVRQWDSRNAEWFNSIVFKNSCGDSEIEVDADWGLDCYPSDLEMLLAKTFASISTKNTSNSNVSSKQVEDFRVTFRTDMTLDEQFAQDNASVLRKYSLCSTGDIRNGAVCHARRVRIIR